MKHLVMSIVYAPKIEPVMDGRCKQTIRAGRKASIGDEILFHTWDGKPYSKGSKWNNLKRVVVTECIDIHVSKNYIGMWERSVYFKYGWKKLFCDKLAALDFIDPPTGEALRDVLFGLNKIPKEPAEYQIIRWIDKPSCDNCVTDCQNQMTEGDDGRCLSYKSKVN